MYVVGVHCLFINGVIRMAVHRTDGTCNCFCASAKKAKKNLSDDPHDNDCGYRACLLCDKDTKLTFIQTDEGGACDCRCVAF